MSKLIRITALTALLFAPAAVQAQEPLGGWQGLKASSLETIYVTDDTGRQTEGKLLKFDTDSLVMLVDGTEQRFDAQRVLRIEKRGDSVKNGALIGGALGLLFSGIAMGIADCPTEDGSGSCTGSKVAGFVIGTGLYTAMGAGIDAMIVRRTRVYDAGHQVAIRSIHNGPQLAVRVSW